MDRESTFSILPIRLSKNWPNGVNGVDVPSAGSKHVNTPPGAWCSVRVPVTYHGIHHCCTWYVLFFVDVSITIAALFPGMYEHVPDIPEVLSQTCIMPAIYKKYLVQRTTCGCSQLVMNPPGAAPGGQHSDSETFPQTASTLFPLGSLIRPGPEPSKPTLGVS